ncbi:LysR family transcriptional regulator [Mesorhizobium sp. 1B3]|uniref:LysR family transcriptional regulator n=1 Tax=Mesorhizobium sp. 1B3 TaxID=3243599 RepID=UPI003D998930
MKDLNLGQLRTFADVVELGSFSAAAERAGISQPAVSLQIRQLERQLGVRLVERVGRRAQATPAGHDLLAHAARIQEEVARAIEATVPHRRGAAGRIRIGTGATACIYLLPRVLKQLKEDMPGLEIIVHTGNTADVLKLLEANRLDVALVTLPASGRAFVVDEIYRDELVAVVPDGEDAPSQAVSPAFMAGKPLLLYESGGNTRRLVDRWFLRAGFAPKPAMELGSVEAIKQLVGAGLGWAILPKLAVDRAPLSEEIAWRSLSPRLSRSLAIIMRRDKHMSRGIREMVAALKGAAR